MKNKDILHKEYHFIRPPQPGDVVKVYMNKHEDCYGVVCGTFQRKEHRSEYVNSEGKIMKAYVSITDCVMLKPIDSFRVSFDAISFFLDIDRVDFKII